MGGDGAVGGGREGGGGRKAGKGWRRRDRDVGGVRD